MKSLAFALTALVAGCASLSSQDPASPHYAYTTGWSVELRRPLAIEPGAATVRLQHGRVVPRNSVQRRDPHCVIELNTVSDGPQTVRPGRFEVVRVTRSMSDFLASAPPGVRAMHRVNDYGPSFLYFITEFKLHDPEQPALRSMTCAWDQAPPGSLGLMRHLTLDEIRSALGDWMQFIPPEKRL